MCEETLFQNKLALPLVGLCTENTNILILCIILTIVVQFIKHYIKDIMSIKRFELLSKQNRPCNKITSYVTLQFWKSLTWVLSLLLITNANIYIIVTHVIADVVFSAFWISNTNKETTNRSKRTTF